MKKSLIPGLILPALLLLFVMNGCKKKSDDPIPASTTVTDTDGNLYHTLTLGTQTWMVENLKVTHYRNGDPIPVIVEDTAWSELTTGARCAYEHDTALGSVYGQFYNWFAVTDLRQICPAGWHVATDQEWQTLIDHLGGEAVAGGKMKERDTLHWLSPNTGATNESGFTALPAGARSFDGMFYLMQSHAFFWSSTGTTGNMAWFRYLEDLDAYIGRTADVTTSGFSVRCIHD